MSGDEADEIQHSLGRIEAKIDAGFERLDRHERTLYGNGIPGVVEQIGVMKSQLSEVRGADESAGKASRAAIVSIGTLVAGLGAWIAQAFGIKIGN